MLRRNTQPGFAHIKGAFAHSLSWLTSSSQDVRYDNPGYKADTSPEEAVAIWCVHGTADRNHAFKAIAASLQHDLADNVQSIFLPAFDDRFSGKSIIYFALQLREKIIASNIKNVVLMGHSRGGLIISYLAAYLAEDAGVTVKVVYAIGSPYRGSDRAGGFLSWLSESVREMEVESEFLDALVMKIKESKIPHVYFAALQDSLVPIHSTHVPGQHGQCIVLPGDGHLSMVSSPELIAQLRAHLLLEKVIVVPVHTDKSEVHESVTLTSASSMPLEKEFDEFVMVDSSQEITSPQELTVRDACLEIEAYLTEMKMKKHLWSAEAKIQLLENLRASLKALYEGDRPSAYPEASTVGDYISAFLQDASVGSGGIKPVLVLNKPLNFPFSLVSSSNADTQVFIMQMVFTYQNVKLPDMTKELKMNNDETQLKF